MKQCISEEQFNQLSDNKLVECTKYFNFGEGLTYKWWTLGKMIEILGDNLYCMTKDEVTHNWYIVIGSWNGWRIDKTELVDCLWEAIMKKI